ncbi:MAG: hypothetical protein AB1921_01215 [Thermodesulfobacteriota bacterium]
MPWRKYPCTEGQFDRSYQVDKGVQVRCDARQKWTVFVEKGGQRNNVTVGEGREGLGKAVGVAEKIMAELETGAKKPACKQPAQAPDFEDFSRKWLEGAEGRVRKST